MIICGCAMEAQYQLRLTEQREHKPLYIKDRIGKYTRRRDKKNAEQGKQTQVREGYSSLPKGTPADDVDGGAGRTHSGDQQARPLW